MDKKLTIGTFVEAPDYDMKGRIVEVRKIGHGVYYRVNVAGVGLVDFDSSELRVLPKRDVR
jgi:hypothetical protein